MRASLPARRNGIPAGLDTKLLVALANDNDVEVMHPAIGATIVGG